MTAWLRRLHAVLPMTRGAAYGIVFLFFLSVVGNVGAYALAVRNRASITQLCQAGNVARTQQIILWDHVIAVSQPPPGETPARRKQRLATIRAFEAYIHRVFAPRNCQHPAQPAHPAAPPSGR